MKNELNSLTRKERKEQKKLIKRERYFQKYGIYPPNLQEKKELSGLKNTGKMFRYFKGHGWQLAIMVVLLILTVVVDIVSSCNLAIVVDKVVAGDFAHIWPNLLLYGLTFFTGIIYFVYDIVSARMRNDVTYQIRKDVVKATEASKITKFDTMESGKIISRLNSDPSSFASNFDDILFKIKQLINRFGVLFIFVAFSWKYSLYLVVAVILLYLIDRFIINKLIIPARARDEAIDDNFNSQSSELVRGIRDIKNLNIAPHFINKFNKTAKHLRNSNIDESAKSAFENDFFGGSGFFDIIYLGGFLLSIYLVSVGELSVGQFSTMMMYAYDVFFISYNFSSIYKIARKMEVSAKRMCELLDEDKNPKEKFGNVVLQNPQGSLEFENVKFGYDNQVVFDNLSFKIPAKKCVGIVGASGEGKSTIFNLIQRMYDVDDGRVLIDGTDVRDLTKDSLRDTVSIVSQSPYIFNMTILENLKLVNPQATQDEIEEACKRAAILDFILSKPDGFNTFVGEGGVMLSGGQKQRIAIARAFLKKSKILLLDEATSALDNKSQNEIKKAIHNMQSTCTIMIIAHRLSTVQDCDTIMVLDEHKVVGAGKHEALIKNCKAYRELYEQEEKE